MSEKINSGAKMKKLNTSVTELLMCVVGTFMYALAVSLFVTPLKFAAGGVTGLGILVNYLVPFISTGTFVFAANIPLFILAWRKFGFRFIARTVFSTALMSGFIVSPCSAPFLKYLEIFIDYLILKLYNRVYTGNPSLK